VQILAAHRVVRPGDRKARRALLDQNAADALTARPPVDAREDNEHLRLVGAADQGLHSVELEGVPSRIGIGLVIGDIGAGVGLGHADRQDRVAAAHRRQDARLDGARRVGCDDPGLHADLAEHRHRRDVAGLGDLLEHESSVEDRQSEPTILLRHRHPEDSQIGEGTHVFPREGPIHIARRARPKFALRQVADRLHKAALLI